MIGRRTGVYNTGNTGGGGGPPPTPGLFEVGPDYGSDSGNDGITHEVGVAVAVESVGTNFEGVEVGVAVAVDSVDPTFEGPAVGVATAVSDVDPTFTGTGVGVAVAASVQINDLYADQDTYVGADSLCTDNLNHDGEDLSFDGLLVQEKEVLLGWDLSTLDGEVTAAELVVQWKANLLEILANDVDIYSVDDADEGWDETTVTCSTRPAQDTLLQTFSWTPSGIGVGVSQTVTLNSSVIARLNERIATGHCTLLLNLSTANLLSREMESKDEGTNDNLGPRLNLTLDLSA